jgi:type IV secretion system protein VirB4
MALQFRRYAGSQIHFSRQGQLRARRRLRWVANIMREARIGRIARFPAFARNRRAAERSWAADWIGALLAHEKVSVTPEVKESIWSRSPQFSRRHTGGAHAHRPFAVVAIERTQSRPHAYTLDGPFRALARCAENRLTLAEVSASRPRN